MTHRAFELVPVIERLTPGGSGGARPKSNVRDREFGAERERARARAR
jgi:hypothetical protein